jgi:hypothetical protein
VILGESLGIGRAKEEEIVVAGNYAYFNTSILFERKPTERWPPLIEEATFTGREE